MYVCMYVCMHVCIYMYVCKPYVYTVSPSVLSIHSPALPSILLPSILLYVRISVYPSIFPLIHPPTDPLTFTPNRLPTYPVTYLHFYLFPGNLISSFRRIQCILPLAVLIMSCGVFEQPLALHTVKYVSL